MIYIFIERICCRKSKTALFIPDLFPESKIVAGEGRIFPLELITAGVEIAEEFHYESIAQLIGGIHIEPVIETGNVVASQVAGGDISVEEGKIAADIELGSQGY